MFSVLIPGKIFPGVITLQGIYGSSILIVNSVEYEELFQNLTQFVSDDFSDFFYIFNTFLNLRQTGDTHCI